MMWRVLNVYLRGQHYPTKRFKPVAISEIVYPNALFVKLTLDPESAVSGNDLFLYPSACVIYVSRNNPSLVAQRRVAGSVSGSNEQLASCLMKRKPSQNTCSFSHKHLIYMSIRQERGTWQRSWLRHYATSRKVAGSIFDVTVSFLIYLNLPAALWSWARLNF
jgi:hypothetical protein